MIGPFDYMVMRSKLGDELETCIDGALRGALRSRAQVAVTVEIRDYPIDIVEAVASRYREKGWKVDIVSDSRDGDFIALELPR